MSKTYDKTIIVTGGAGFIGSNFLNSMVPKYESYHFVVLDALTAVGDRDNITVQEKENCTFIQIDIRNTPDLRTVFETYKPTDIIHFAAESHVDVSIKNPQLFIETNIGGTANLLALALEYKLARFHQVSTDEVYGSLAPNDPAFTEESPLAPNNPYSASKASADMLVRAYNRTFGLDTVITRCSNNYGPRQDDTKFIPVAIKALLEGRNIPIYGNGKNIRDWIYVDDHVAAIDTVFHRGVSGEIYNVGCDNEIENIEIATILREIAGRSDTAISFVTDRPGHDHRYAITSTKAQALGWKPKRVFAEGLSEKFAWYKERYQQA